MCVSNWKHEAQIMSKITVLKGAFIRELSHFLDLSSLGDA